MASSLTSLKTQMLSSDSTVQAAPPITYSTPTNLLALKAVMQAMKPVCDLQAAAHCFDAGPKQSRKEAKQHSISIFDIAASPQCRRAVLSCSLQHSISTCALHCCQAAAVPQVQGCIGKLHCPCKGCVLAHSLPTTLAHAALRGLTSC